MNVRWWLAPALALTACAAQLPSDTERPGGKPAPLRNVLFIVVDDLRPELGCYGGLAITPNLDALAARSLTFERAYCQQAVCGASRTSVLTGLRPHTTGVWGNSPNFRTKLPDVVTLPQLFLQNGWRSEAYGKIYHHTDAMQDPASWSVPAGRWDGWLWADSPQFNFDRRGPASESAAVDDLSYPDGEIARAAAARLRAFANTEESFFLAVGMLRPHLPFNAPKRYWDLYERDAIPLPEATEPASNAPPWQLTSWGELRSYDDIPSQGSLDQAKTRELRHAYLACASYVDAQLGIVLETLRDTGLEGETLVVLWSDHGWKLGDYGAWSKHTNVELDTRVPLMLAVPGRSDRGMRTPALAELIDLYPTIAELCGLRTPPEVEGVSLTPLLDDPEATVREAAFSFYPRTAQIDGMKTSMMGDSMRTDRWRLTHWRRRNDPFATIAIELYDHHADPLEQNNLADDPAYAAIIDDLLRDATPR